MNHAVSIIHTVHVIRIIIRDESSAVLRIVPTLPMTPHVDRHMSRNVDIMWIHCG
jgi:hypothetical protein